MPVASREGNAVKKKVGRPLRGDAPRVRVSFTLPPHQSHWLQKEAAARRTSKSELLERVIQRAESEFGTGKQLAIPIPRERIVEFCRNHKIKKLALFGSALRSDFRPESDIDLLVEFQPGGTPSLFQLPPMEAELSRIFSGRTIDLKTPAELSRYFRPTVMAEAEVLYAAPG